MSLDKSQLRSFVEKKWDESIVPTLSDYIRIPNLSPAFDPNWASKPDTEQAVKLLSDWAAKQELKGFSQEVLRDGDRTPLIFITVEGTDNTQETIMMYGHLDKQPPTDGWLTEEDIHPYKPTIKDGIKLYGRGGADDGYAIFAAITSLKALQLQGLPHARVVIIIEACEESGSPDLSHYISLLKTRIGNPSLVVCLDSGCGNYEQFWLTTSLRGMMSASISVQILKEGVHSGAATGIVPSSFRIFRQVLGRLEDLETGVVNKAFHVEITEKHRIQAQEAAKALGNSIYEEFPWIEGAHPVTTDLSELLLNRNWRPTVAVTGVAGFPTLEKAGNVLRPQSTFMISLRLPPTFDSTTAPKILKELIEKDPPYGAKVTCEVHKAAPGWAAPVMEDWLANSVNVASETYFGKPVCYTGEGGSIPFMGMLGEMFPAAQFIITGLLGPKSNAHGPNEFLHIPMAKNLTCSVSAVVLDHYLQKHKK